LKLASRLTHVLSIFQSLRVPIYLQFLSPPQDHSTLGIRAKAKFNEVEAKEMSVNINQHEHVEQKKWLYWLVLATWDIRS
jgi:hypothetical protein